MPFEYRLAVLLKLQGSMERQEENRLLACSGRVAQLKAELQSIAYTRIRRRRNEHVQMREGVPAALISLATEWDAAMKARELEAKGRLAAAEQERLRQMEVFRTARQKREVLDSLKQQLKSVFDAEELRRIQQRLDDTFLMRTFVWKDS